MMSSNRTHAVLSPKGTLITSTMETLVARHNVLGVDDAGSIDWGDNLEIIYDSQMTMRNEKDQRVFCDEAREEYPEDECFMLPIEELDEALALIASGTPVSDVPGIKRYNDQAADVAA